MADKNDARDFMAKRGYAYHPELDCKIAHGEVVDLLTAYAAAVTQERDALLWSVATFHSDQCLNFDDCEICEAVRKDDRPLAAKNMRAAIQAARAACPAEQPAPRSLKGKLPPLDLDYKTSQPSASPQPALPSIEVGRFELRKDDETGRLYWFGAEEGWRDKTEIGESGFLTMSPDHFPVGTVLKFEIPARTLEEQQNG